MSEKKTIKKMIRRMDQSVIDKIAKGDVIESVVDVVKEIIENSLDADSTKIEIRLAAKGLSMIQVNDNGSGIQSVDLPFVCEHFTTSKLFHDIDLNALNTLGFRGEALSAISYLSNLTIISKTCSDKCAFAMKYMNGKAQNAPYPCAGNVGTQITVENLFYNSPLRQSFKRNAQLSLSQTKCLIKCFAIHYCHVGFLIKLIDNDQIVLKTAPNSTPIDNIRLLYDNDVSRELIAIDENDDEHNFQLKGLITNASVSMKQFVFILFVNNRLVESSRLQKMIDDIYEAYLSKNGKPFVYLSLDVDTNNLDVNMHARKCEVFILNENEICKKIGLILKRKLLSQNQSRTFFMQSKLKMGPCAQSEPFFWNTIDFADNQTSALPSSHNCRPLLQSKSLTNAVQFDPNDFDEQQPIKNPYPFLASSKSSKPRLKESATNLKSVEHLRSSIKQCIDSRISDILSDSKFSGCLEFKHFLIQKDTKIFICNTEHILIDYLYQKVLFNLRNLNILSFDEPMPILEILDARATNKWPEMSKNQAYNTLIQFSSILSQYFSIEINKSFGTLLGLPELFEQYKPEIKQLPNFLFDLVKDLNGTDETNVIDSVTKQIVHFYLNSFRSRCAEKSIEWEHFLETIVFPELKTKYRSTKKVAEQVSIIQVTDLNTLLSSFERC